jgi:hypothetical protein
MWMKRWQQKSVPKTVFLRQATALILIPLTWQLGTLVAGLILGGFVFFYILSKAGERLVLRNIQNESRYNTKTKLHYCTTITLRPLPHYT